MKRPGQGAIRIVAGKDRSEAASHASHSVKHKHKNARDAAKAENLEVLAESAEEHV
jgi:hypothetical protein